MAEIISVVGVADDKPLTPAVKTKVQNALKTALAEELSPAGGIIRPGSHFSVTHTSIVFSEQ